MSEQAKQTVENLNTLLEKINDSGKDRRLDFGNGYICGFHDGSAAISESAQQPAVPSV